MNPYTNIKPEQDLAQNERLLSWFDALGAELNNSHQRACVLLRGPREWGISVMSRVSYRQSIILSDELAGAVCFSKAENLLGQETDCVVYDIFSGINSDVLCMGVGLIRSAGLLLLLCPEDLHEITDEYGSWQQHSAAQPIFISYLLQQCSGWENFYSIYPEGTLPQIKPLAYSALVEIDQGETAQQHALIQQLKDWLSKKAKPLFFITADRGRGKSTALGKFASQLDDEYQVVVSAASRIQVAILLREVGSRHCISFKAPDEIIRCQQRIALLIIDEAAMLPASMLQQCIELADRTILATTTGGYEGTGQGFLLKFMAGFAASQYCRAELKQAVRWGQNDLLEQGMNQALMLNSIEFKPAQKNNKVTIQLISKTDLVSDLALLREVYQLLVSAHYRTRPSDLRQLMEDANQRVLIARDENQLLGVLLLNQEGGFAVPLSEEIFMGRRRPQGHLLAQMLTAQAGVKYFSCYRGYRVQRIAVAQHYRRQGLGRMLIEQAKQRVQRDQLDYLGSSFSLDQGNAAFWKSCGLQLMHIASGRGKSSGRQTLVLLHSAQPQVLADMQLLQQKIHQDLPLWLLGYCNEMYWRDVLVILSLLHSDQALSLQDRQEVQAFAFGFRGLDYALPALQRFLIVRRAELTRLNTGDQRTLIEKILLNRSWQAVLQHSDYAGRKPLLKKLRESIGELYEHT